MWFCTAIFFLRSTGRLWRSFVYLLKLFLVLPNCFFKSILLGSILLSLIEFLLRVSRPGKSIIEFYCAALDINDFRSVNLDESLSMSKLVALGFSIPAFSTKLFIGNFLKFVIDWLQEPECLLWSFLFMIMLLYYLSIFLVFKSAFFSWNDCILNSYDLPGLISDAISAYEPGM